MMFCKGEAHSIACVSYSATYGNSVSILQTNPNFYLILFVPAVQDVPFDLQKKYQKKIFRYQYFFNRLNECFAIQGKRPPIQDGTFGRGDAPPFCRATPLQT